MSLLDRLTATGVILTLSGDNLIVRPEAPLTAEQLAYLAAHKAELVAELTVLQNLGVIVAMRERGICPPHYTAITMCRGCGLVPIWEGCAPEVSGCPWCLSRHADKPIPAVPAHSESLLQQQHGPDDAA